MSTGENSKKHHHHEVFSAERAGHLDTRLRRFLYRPDRLAGKYVKPGDRVLDFGCGPGFFTREFAKRVGDSGQVYSVDLQEEMLGILRGKLGPEGLLPRITTHRCEPDSIGLPPAKLLPNMRILSVAPLLGEVIRRAHEGRSVGEMFNE